MSPVERSHIDAGELLAAIDSGRPPAILDVRSRREFDQGHVPGAVHFPFWAAFSRAGSLPGSRDAPVVVYCEHGPRAGMAKLALRRAGFHDVRYLRGHMSGWKKAGRPQETDRTRAH